MTHLEAAFLYPKAKNGRLDFYVRFNLWTKFLPRVKAVSAFLRDWFLSPPLTHIVFRKTSHTLCSLFLLNTSLGRKVVICRRNDNVKFEALQILTGANATD